MNMTITIIGSLKFKEEMRALSNVLSLSGNMVYCAEDKFVGIEDVLGVEIDDDFYREKINDFYKNLICVSDVIIVYNKDKYIGESTMDGFLMARSCGTKVVFKEPDERFTEREESPLVQQTIITKDNDSTDTKCIIHRHMFYDAY